MSGTGSSPAMDGTGLPKAHVRMALDIAIGTVNVTVALHAKILDWLSTADAHSLPATVVARYGPRIEFVHTALQASGYEPSTVDSYTHVVGELLLWVDANAEGNLTPDNVCSFLDYYVARGRKGGELRLGSNTDEKGQGVRYLAYHALKTILDTLFGMELTHTCARPDHPPPTKPAAPDVTRQLFGVADTDRELLLLLMTNGLKLRPSQSALLMWHCVSPDCRWVTVLTTKGIETVEIDSRFRSFLAHLRDRSCRQGFLFPSPRGGGSKPVSVRTLQNVLARMVQRAGIEDRVTLTALRKAQVQIPPESCLRKQPTTGPRMLEDARCACSEHSGSQEQRQQCAEVRRATALCAPGLPGLNRLGRHVACQRLASLGAASMGRSEARRLFSPALSVLRGQAGLVPRKLTAWLSAVVHAVMCLADMPAFAFAVAGG